METFYHCLIGKQFNVEIVKTQISQEPIITFHNNILAPQTRWEWEKKINGARFGAFHFIPIILGS